MQTAVSIVNESIAQSVVGQFQLRREGAHTGREAIAPREDIARCHPGFLGGMIHEERALARLPEGLIDPAFTPGGQPVRLEAVLTAFSYNGFSHAVRLAMAKALDREAR